MNRVRFYFWSCLWLFMVALCNRADHYIFIMWLLLSSFFFFFSSPNLSGRRLDVYHTSTHGVALVVAILCNTAGHYIFTLWFLYIFYLLSIFFSSPNGWRRGYRRLSHERSYPTSGPVSTGMGDRLWAGIPSRYVTSQLG